MYNGNGHPAKVLEKLWGISDRELVTMPQGCAILSRALAEIGDEERVAAGVCERRRDRHDPAAVAVRLDDGSALRRCRAPRKLAPVGDERGKIDRQNAAGFLFRSRACLDRVARRWLAHCARLACKKVAVDETEKTRRAQPGER